MASSKSQTDSASAVKRWLVALSLVAVGGGLYFFRDDRRAVWALLIGTAAVVGLLFFYRLLLRLFLGRRSGPLQQAIMRNTAALPRGANSPALRAAMDDLRKKFEAGLAKFRAAGKDLYSLPWYLIVGEPGSGKTEAIRRCNVGFPPGLQDGSQGAGGTINMNWWFTNHAILIDTAGRLVFQDAAAGRGAEWDEFLRLLTQSRPNCPINGMLLVIPADTLITDTADQIEAKAVNIARQLDHIQRSLGVRFPVFVVVTKCDRMNGFREFFENLTDPQLQHQMLGWSNPDPRDELFRPEMLDQHLLAIRGRLLKRRQVFLVDPIHTQDPQIPRIEQVDALYTFPDAFVRIGPRLRRYLEMIFMPAEWSPRPLFLRGIYFTSSIRAGTALDAELADAMQLPVESLSDDGRYWEPDRAYFLRDLFINKIFREKGLVSRAVNTLKQQRHRKMVILGTAFAAVLLLLYFSWAGARSLNQSIGEQTRFWTAIDSNWNAHRADWSIVQPSADGAFRYNGDFPVDLGGSQIALDKVFIEALKQADRRIEVPWIFRPLQAMRHDQGRGRRKACRGLLEATVLVPVIDASRQKLQSTKALAWSLAAETALVELIRQESAQASAGHTLPDSLVDREVVHLEPLMQFLLTADEFQRFKGMHLDLLREAMGRAYAPVPLDSATIDWPPTALAIDSEGARKTIDLTLASKIEFHLTRIKGANRRLVDIKFVLNAVARFEQAEDAFLAVAKEAVNAPQTDAQFTRYRPQIMALLHEIEVGRQFLDEAMARLQRDEPLEKPLRKQYEIEIDRDLQAMDRFDQRLAQQKLSYWNGEADSTGNAALSHLQTVKRQIAAGQERLNETGRSVFPDELRDELARADRLYLARVRAADAEAMRDYQLLGQVYGELQKHFVVGGTETERNQAVERFQTLMGMAPSNERLQQAGKLGKSLVEWLSKAGKV